jgi:hypothetical protein
MAAMGFCKRLGCLSPIRGLMIDFRAVFLGLTPQAKDLPPLRGWLEPS